MTEVDDNAVKVKNALLHVLQANEIDSAAGLAEATKVQSAPTVLPETPVNVHTICVCKISNRIVEF